MSGDSLGPGVRRRAAIRIALTAAILGVWPAVGQVPLSAHYPNQVGYVWTCDDGEGRSSQSGECFNYHSFANARVWKQDPWSWPGGWGAAVNAGHGVWDRTNGHQFDYIIQSTNSLYNSDIRVVAAPCGNDGWVGCARAVDSGGHIVEGSSFIEFKASTSANKTNAAIHEFGHLLGLGHSSSSSAVMWYANTNRTSLHTYDKDGRCNVYGHAHGYWGGCASHGGAQ